MNEINHLLDNKWPMQARRATHRMVSEFIYGKKKKKNAIIHRRWRSFRKNFEVTYRCIFTGRYWVYQYSRQRLKDVWSFSRFTYAAIFALLVNFWFTKGTPFPTYIIYVTAPWRSYRTAWSWRSWVSKKINQINSKVLYLPSFSPISYLRSHKFDMVRILWGLGVSNLIIYPERIWTRRGSVAQTQNQITEKRVSHFDSSQILRNPHEKKNP